MVPKPTRLGFFPVKSISGSNHSDMRGPMFRIPAYDPLAIAVMGCGIIWAAAIAFPF
jgi:hypothetical protein